MQDLIFTTRGATAGAILVEWNIQARTQGSAGLWDCHARVGGATGTELTPAECPASTSGVDAGCSAASLMMHLTSEASGYFENMWLWGADHMLEYVSLSCSLPARDSVTYEGRYQDRESLKFLTSEHRVSEHESQTYVDVS